MTVTRLTLTHRSQRGAPPDTPDMTLPRPMRGYPSGIRHPCSSPKGRDGPKDRTGRPEWIVDLTPPERPCARRLPLPLGSTVPPTARPTTLSDRSFQSLKSALWPCRGDPVTILIAPQKYLLVSIVQCNILR